MKKQIQLPSGHKLTLNPASLDDAQELLAIVADEARKIRLEITKELIMAMLDEQPLTKLQALEGIDVNMLWNALTTLLASRQLRVHLYLCMRTCMLNAQGPDEAIVPASFEPENARPDWLPVAREVMAENLLPFFEGLGSVLPALKKQTEQNRK